MHKEKPNRLYWLFLFLASSIFFVRGQDRKIADSVIQILNTQKLDLKQQAKQMSVLAYYHPNLDSALYYANRSFEIAVRVQDAVHIAEALEEISHVEWRLGNNSKSLAATFKALHIYDSLGLKERQGASYNQLASNYITDKKPREAIKYLKSARSLYRQTKSKSQETATLLNLGETYRILNLLDSAKLYCDSSLLLNRTLQNPTIEGYALGNLGMIYRQQGDHVAAKTALSNAISLLDSLNDSYSTAIYLAELGQVYEKGGDTKKAEELYLAALQKAETSGLKEEIKNISKILSFFYESKGKLAQALHFQRKYQHYQDSLVNRESIEKIEQIKSQFEIDKRESTISMLNNVNTTQKRVLFFLTVGVLLLITLLLLLRRANINIKKANIQLAQQKKIIEISEKEKSILLRELNHRVKNNLQIISSILNLQENGTTLHAAREALSEGRSRVDALALVHRLLQQENVNTYISLKSYVEQLIDGLFYAYQVKFTAKTEIIEIDISIDIAVPLCLILNELIVNSLKYAYAGIDAPELSVLITRTDDNVELLICDNGIGFDQHNTDRGCSFGLQLIHSLIQQIDATFTKLHFPGTAWKITLPNP